MSGEKQSLEEQITTLQSQAAFQEDAIAALDEALATQQQEILLLRRQLELLQERLKEQAATHDSGVEPAIDKPPHY